ncbi:MAG: SDR family oxidoreductase [Pirellulaceae bacterium]
MRIAILGAAGLIGHKLLEKMTDRFEDVFGLVRKPRAAFPFLRNFSEDRIFDNVDVRNFEYLTGMLRVIDMDVILNCVGITKRRPEIKDWLTAIDVNSMFPHRLANWAAEHGKRVIHFSTDCVFDGELGNYNEDSVTTGRDAYGRTKALGEIRYDHSLTIRSSFIGRELAEFSELLEWFLAQRGPKIRGFRQAWYSGISTIEMARIVGDIIELHPDLNGLYQLSMSEPINKFDLLCLARDAFGRDIEIEPDDSFITYPTLDSSRLRQKMPIELPTWPEMMAALAAEKVYDSIHQPASVMA